jgi:translation initiation factor 1 (eIF-1/SUI1)
LRLIKNYIQDAIYSIENGNPTKQDLDKIQKELAKHFAIWMGVFDNSLLTNIIQGLNKEDVVKAIRSL